MYCFVAGCPNFSNAPKGTKKARWVQIFFSAPEDEALFSQWQSAVPKSTRPFSRSDKLCDFHFKKSEVLLFNETKLPNGNVRRVPAKEPKLRAGTVPSIFPSVESSSDEEEINRTHSRRKHSATVEETPKVAGRTRKKINSGLKDAPDTLIDQGNKLDSEPDDNDPRNVEALGDTNNESQQIQPSIRVVPLMSLLSPDIPDRDSKPRVMKKKPFIGPKSVKERRLAGAEGRNRNTKSLEKPSVSSEEDRSKEESPETPDQVPEKKTLEELAAELAEDLDESTQSGGPEGCSKPKITEVISLCGIDDEDNLMKNKVSDVYDDNDIEIEMARMLGEEVAEKEERTGKTLPLEQSLKEKDVSLAEQELDQNEKSEKSSDKEDTSNTTRPLEITDIVSLSNKTFDSSTGENSETSPEKPHGNIENDDSEIDLTLELEQDYNIEDPSEGDSFNTQSEVTEKSEKSSIVCQVLTNKGIESTNPTLVQTNSTVISEELSNISEGVVDSEPLKMRSVGTLDGLGSQEEAMPRKAVASEPLADQEAESESPSVHNELTSEPALIDRAGNTTSSDVGSKKTPLDNSNEVDNTKDTKTHRNKKVPATKRKKRSKPLDEDLMDIDEILPSSPEVLNLSSDSEVDPTWAPTIDEADTDTDADLGEDQQHENEGGNDDGGAQIVPPNKNVSSLFTQDTLHKILKSINMPLSTTVTVCLGSGPSSPGITKAGSTRVYKRRRGLISAEKKEETEKVLGLKMFEGLGKIKKSFEFSTFLSDVDDELQFKKFCLVVNECLKEVRHSKNAVTNIGKLTINISRKKIRETKTSQLNESLEPEYSSTKESEDNQVEEAEMFECITVDSNVENHYETTPNIEESMEMSA